MLFKKYGVTYIAGKGALAGPKEVKVAPLKGSPYRLQAGNIIIATGARPRVFPGLEPDGKQVITAREALVLPEIPEKLVIVGAGAIGVEFAYLYNVFGSKITLIEMEPAILPVEDHDISRELARLFKKRKIDVMTGTSVQKIERRKSQVKVHTAGKHEGTVTADVVLMAAGVTGNVEDLGLEETGVGLDRGYVTVDSSMATNVSGVYAIGDVTGILLLAHVAQAQGVLAVERIAGQDSPDLNYEIMPRATYCRPQVASFGLTEKQAIERGHRVKIGRFPFQASGKAQAMGDTEGMVKVVADEEYGELLGVHMIGPEVTELLGEFSLGRLLEGTIHEVGWLVHSHPTLSEALKEAALAADGKAIHI